MRYIDIFIKACALSPRDFQLTFRTRPGDRGYDRLNRKVLAWSANHEHAVFDLHDEVHPATVYVWFEWHSKGLWYRGSWNTIYKIKRFKTVLNADNWWYDWDLWSVLSAIFRLSTIILLNPTDAMPRATPQSPSFRRTSESKTQ